MRIGIFTDTYRPSVNGIVYVTEILRSNFEKLGHEVYIFAPGDSLRVSDQDSHIVQFPAIRGAFFDEFNASLFFPPSVLKKIEELDLDIIHFLTPGQVGLMGVYASKKLDIPLVAEYCTDLFEYVDHYSNVLPGLIALSAIMPFTIGGKRQDFVEVFKASRPRFGLNKWNKEIVRGIVTLIHQRCDAVIVHSRKSYKQLSSWWKDKSEAYEMQIIPTGVDCLPKATEKEIRDFRKEFGIADTDKVFTYIGRLSAEKNLDILIDVAEKVVKKCPEAKLMYVGDFDYRPKLEEKAAKSSVKDRIIFTGKIPREKLGKAHTVTKVFVFPSMTDTQSLVVNEAACSGIPIVIMDKLVSEVVEDGVNGYYSGQTASSMASKVLAILSDDKLQADMSKQSIRISSEYSELAQAKKIEALYSSILDKIRLT